MGVSLSSRVDLHHAIEAVERGEVALYSSDVTDWPNQVAMASDLSYITNKSWLRDACDI